MPQVSTNISQQSSPTHMYVPAETSGPSSPMSRANAPFQMINLAYLVLDVSPLSTVHPPPQKKATPSVSKIVKTSEESRFKGYDLRNPSMHADDSENPTEVEKSATDKELRKFVASILKEVNSDVSPDVQTYLEKDLSLDNDSSEKVEENIPEHRLQRRKGKTVIFEDSPSREVKRKDNSLKGTPSRSSTGKSHVRPTRLWSKVVTPTRKRKDVSSSESEFDVEQDVQDITLIKIFANKKPHDARSKAPLGNASLHYVKNAERWKYVIQMRVTLERELGKDALKCNKVMELIEGVGLMKTVTHFGPCYENLVKEFMMIIPDGCDDTKSDDYGKVYVRGNVVTFSPTVINKFIGRTDEPQVELEVTNDQVCKEITTNQVRHWLNKGKLFAGKLSVKYAILHRIGTSNWVPTNHTSTIFTGLGKFIYVVGTKRAFDFGKYIFEQVLKQAFSTVVKMPICFPSLICGIILNQHPSILLPIDSVKKRDSFLSLHYKLFAGTHVSDIVMTSSQTPGPATSKKNAIAQLKETCKEIEYSIRSITTTKIKLETLMKVMMKEEKKEVV
ncbi:uncharacterized protein LOC127095744 [Lathyrus oleraceus]|uniref:uncharacterized protein LOC127095744 n=1 Tax=Pisum sativum TaxID=3888 RepID=UPI0021CFC09F|nr:uncharacterized protein LOC127095744 [Pisum sativum]